MLEIVPESQAPAESEADFLAKIQDLILRVAHEQAEELLLEMATEQLSRSGKLLRPRLAYGLGQALRIPSSQFVGWTAACEILHNATLVHDDLQDGDEFRRGFATVWKRHGSAQAINLGDFLVLISTLPILQAGHLNAEIRLELAVFHHVMASRLVNGQSMEPRLNSLANLNSLEDDYLKCVSLKTSALFAGLARGVAIAGGLPKTLQTQIEALFFELGTIFQIQDDVVDLFGDKRRQAKGCDVKEGKVSYLVVTHLQERPHDVDRMRSLLRTPRENTSDTDIANFIRLLESSGALSATLERLQTRIFAVRKQDWLEEFPELGAFVSDFIDHILQPIDHLRGES